MKRLLTATTVCALLLSGTAAEAAKKPSPRAKVYTANLAGGAYGSTGKAQLVDNKRRDSAKIHLEGLLRPGAELDWVVFKVNGDQPACAPGASGTGVEEFDYKPLKVNVSGNASSTARSKAFVAFSTTRYGVRVTDEEGVVLACGELKPKRTAKQKPARKPRA